jgi:hypothetical protein
MRYLFLIIALIVFSCNSNQESEKNVVQNNADKCFVYPSSVDSLHLKDLYDSARWYVYTRHCDQNYLPKSDTSKSITFGELPLRFENLAFKHDTLELNFYFMDHQQPILPSMTRDGKDLSTGVGFSLANRVKIYILSPNGYSTIEKGSATRYENPLQPEVLSYIKNNWGKLDSCFKELAARKGIMK